MEKKKILTSLILLTFVTFLSFIPVLNAGFTNWDDSIMITQNQKIISLSSHSIGTMFTSFHERLYHPLVLMSYALEFKLFGLNPHIFHATSLMLHLTNTLLVFGFIFLLCGSIPVAFLTGLLFGIHPMHVESVAWLSERKDVLYALFFFASLISYLGYIRTFNKKDYFLSFFLFLCSLLSKPMAMTLPLVLVLCDWLKGRKLDRHCVIDKVPFFILSFIFGALTVMGHYEPGVHGREFAFSLRDNLTYAVNSLMFYLSKLIAPFKLSCLYPAFDKLPSLPMLVSILILLALLALMFASLKFTKKATFGGLFFIFTILPVSQILPIGLKVAADRYTYVPYVGLFYVIAEAFEWSFIRANKYLKALLAMILIFALLTLSVLTWQRSEVWKNSSSLWEDVIGKYPQVATAHYNLAEEYFPFAWEMDKALPLFSKAIEANPEYAEAYINRGLIYYYRQNYKSAIWNYDQAEKYRPDLAEIYINRGNAFSALGWRKSAIREYNRALEIKPEQPETWYNRGNVYMAQGRLDMAVADYTKAIELKPSYTDAYFNRAIVYARMKQFWKAYNDALKAKLLGARISDRDIEELKRRATER